MVMAAACLGLALLALHQGGAERMLAGLTQGLVMLLRLSPLLLLAFACAGLITVIASEQAISRWLGKEAGFKGLLLGGLAGAIIPGGPFIFYPIAATLLVSGAEIGTVVCFVTAKNLWTVTRIPIEIALLGVELTFLRYGITIVFPPLAGLMANALFKGSTGVIRSEIMSIQGRSEEPGEAPK